MSLLNQKNLVRYGASFLNIRSHFLLMTGLWWRRNRPFFFFEGQAYSYAQTREQARRYAHFFLAQRKEQVAAGRLDRQERLSIAIYQENTPEFIFSLFGAAVANCVLFAINTGFRGETLATVIRQSKAALIITDPAHAAEVRKALPNITALTGSDIYLSEPEPSSGQESQLLAPAVAAAQATDVAGQRLPIVNTSHFIVIYTSGMTGIPKGVPVTHIKLFGAGLWTQLRIRLNRRDCGYICMPLFHSNSLYLGVMPILRVGASFVLTRKFSASAFEKDALAYGVSYLNYVGQPLHYIIAALENRYGSAEAVEQALAHHPRNRFRKAHGNGASVVDRKKLMRYFNMDHIYELYGSTEAPITTANRPGDPIESLGRIPNSVVILDEQGQLCEPGRTDDNGILLNYSQAVGEICKKISRENVFFDGYFANTKATDQKFRDGYFHSGDLGHVRIIRGKRYLYFNGRTDDWIRKDGENFSAENVLHYAQMLPGVQQAIAYGAPCEVSDEKVMIAIQMQPGAVFDPQAAFDWFMGQQRQGGMDPKWMPDYIRVVSELPVTNTQKIVVRPYKNQGFNLTGQPDMEVYCRRRGDARYHRLTPEGFEAIEQQFVQAGRQALLQAAT